MLKNKINPVSVSIATKVLTVWFSAKSKLWNSRTLTSAKTVIIEPIFKSHYPKDLK